MTEQTQPTAAARRAAKAVEPLIPASAIDDLRRHQMRRSIDHATGLAEVELALGHAVSVIKGYKHKYGLGPYEASVLDDAEHALARLRGEDEQGEASNE